MIEDFTASWDLFRNAYLAGWAVAGMLSLAGVWVVARNQIFLSAAVAQSSTLGIAAGLWAGGLASAEVYPWLGSDTFHSMLAVVFAIAAAALSHRAPRPGEESPEAVSGWIFLAATSGAVLLLAHSPHGTEEIHRVLASSLIGATANDVLVFGVLCGVTVLAVGLRRDVFLLLAMDPLLAKTSGIDPRFWGLAHAVWLGLISGLAMRSAGLVYTFGCLVLPALIAKNVSREMRQVLLLAPLLGVGLSVIGFVLANHFDYPPAQMTVGLMSLLLLLVWIVRAMFQTSLR